MSKLIIDISYHNGKVDLKKAQPYISGIVARCSYGWSLTNIDKQWENNATQANALGLPLFAYHFCYARNESEALKEAKLALKACKNYKVNVIYYDMESSDYQGRLNNEMYYKIAKTFCDEIEASGYAVGVYANEDWFKNRLTNEGFSAWTLWLANFGVNNGNNNWAGKLNYNPFGHVLLHQFTSKAKNGVLKNIQGISSSGLDCSEDHGLLELFGNRTTNNNPTPTHYQVGDKVRVKRGSTWYDGKNPKDFVFDIEYEVIQVKGDRVVIGLSGNVTGAIRDTNLY